MIRRLLLALAFVATATAADAQGVGVFVRASCSVINSPIVGSTLCFDSTFNQLRAWNGISWVAVGAQPQPAGSGTVATLTMDPNGRLTVPGGIVSGSSFRIGTIGAIPTDQGAGTISAASATFSNNLAAIVASGTGPNLANLRGVSASSSLSNNLRGTCTFASAATCVVSFSNNEPDSHYFVVTGCAVDVSGKAPGGFTMTGTKTSTNACDWMVVR